jgi:hypothetical protein
VVGSIEKTSSLIVHELVRCALILDTMVPHPEVTIQALNKAGPGVAALSAIENIGETKLQTRKYFERVSLTDCKDMIVEN